VNRSFNDRGVVRAVSLIVVSIIFVLGWLVAFPRVAHTPVPAIKSAEPTVSRPRTPERTIAESAAIQPSASPAPRAEPNVRRPPRSVTRERHTNNEWDRSERDRDVFLGLMLFLVTQRQPQAP